MPGQFGMGGMPMGGMAGLGGMPGMGMGAGGAGKQANLMLKFVWINTKPSHFASTILLKACPAVSSDPAISSVPKAKTVMPTKECKMEVAVVEVLTARKLEPKVGRCTRICFFSKCSHSNNRVEDRCGSSTATWAELKG